MPREAKEPANTVNLAGTMPPEQHNGLKGSCLEAMVEDPGARRYAVVEFYGLYDKRNTDDGTHQIIVRLTRIEPVDGEDAAMVQKLLDAARATRLGELNYSPGDELGSYPDPQDEERPDRREAEVHLITSARRGGPDLGDDPDGDSSYATQ